MIKKTLFIFLCCLSVLASAGRPTVITDEGSGLAPQEVAELKQMAKEAIDEYESNKNRNDAYSEDDIYSSLGINSINADDNNTYDDSNPFDPTRKEDGSQGFSMRQQGSVDVRCEAGANAVVGGLQINVVSCENAELEVDLCDAESVGFNCGSHNTDRVRLKNVAEVFKDGVFSGEYSLKALCSSVACTIDYVAKSSGSFGTSAASNLADSNRAKAEHMEEGSMFMDYMNLLNPTDPQNRALREETKSEGKDFAECYQDRMDELMDDGKVKQSCDPSNIDTFQFLVDRREGDNHNKQMCARVETGSCLEPIEIHERLDMSGTQTCTNQYSSQSESCTSGFSTASISGDEVISITRTGGQYSNALVTKSSCGNGCTQFVLDNYRYGNNNIKLHHDTAEEFLDFVYYDKSAITKVTFESSRYDGFLRLWSGNTIVLDPHPNNYGLTNNSNNRSIGTQDLTSKFKEGMGVGSTRLRISLWVTNNEGEYYYTIKVWHKTEGDKVVAFNNCTSLESSNPSANSVAGCYQNTNPTCTDSAPRTMTDGVVYNPGCWSYRKDYTCISGAPQGCNTNLLLSNGWVKKEEKNKEYPYSAIGQNTTQPWKWDEVWTYAGSNNYDQSLGCAPSATTTHTDATGGTISTKHTWCYKTAPKECRPSPPETAEEITQCHVEASRYTKTQHGLYTEQEQDYKCETAYVCEGAFGNSVDDESLAADNAKALAKIVAESEKAKALSESLSGNMSTDENGNIAVFGGEAEACYKWGSKTFDNLDNPINMFLKEAIGKTVGGLNRTKRNCCAGNPDDIMLGTNFDNCDEGDIELASRRLEKAAHLINISGTRSATTAMGGGAMQARMTAPQSAPQSAMSGKVCHNIEVDHQDIYGLGSIYVTPDITLGIHKTKVKSPLMFWLIPTNDPKFPHCVPIPDNLYYCDASLTNQKGLDNLLTAITGEGYTVESSQTIIDFSLSLQPISVPTSICKTEEPPKNVIWDETCNNGLGCEREVFEDENGDEYFETDNCPCEQRDKNTGACISQPAVCRVYPDVEVEEDVGDEIETDDGSWLMGNKAMCAWYFDSRFRPNPAVGGANAGNYGVIGTPGTEDPWNWFNDFKKIFNLPFNCQYSIFDAADTIRVDSFQTWCKFDNVFAKLVQEQGRQQLADYATRPYTGATTDTVSFNFYKSGQGAWTSSKIVNGNDIRFWQWPEQCSNRGNLVSDFKGTASMTTQSCPNNADLYVAICPKQNSCGALPANPVLETTKWETRVVRAEDTEETQALTPLVVVRGGCSNTGDCTYNLHAWKKGVGGSVDIPLDLNWSLKSARNGWKINYVGHNNVHFMAYTAGMEDSVIPSPMIKMCVGPMPTCDANKESDATLWKTINLNNPTALSGQVVSSANPKVTAIGQCNSKTLNCSYRININVKLKAKPWHNGVTYDTYSFRLRPSILGKPIGPKHKTKYNYKVQHDCSGFTLDEFLALDIAAMDLTEFTDKVAADAEAKIMEMMSNGLLDGVSADIETLKTGESVAKTQMGTTNFTMSPDNGFPGDPMKLKPVYADKDFGIIVTKNGQTTRHKVNTIEIDWGDGQRSTIGPHQEGEHVYGDRNNPPTKSTTYKGVIKWRTASGDITEGFTYKMWVKGGDTEGGGLSVDALLPGSASSQGKPETDIRKFQHADPSIKALDPSNW